MLDFMLDHKTGDLKITADGDISLTHSVRQAVLIRLRWIYREWRLSPEMGFPWFEEVFVKNPNIAKIKQLVRSEILKVDGVTKAEVLDVTFDKAKRSAKFVYVCYIGEAVFREEVTLYG